MNTSVNTEGASALDTFTELDNSGYDTNTHPRETWAGKRVSRHRYYAVFREGDTNPSDLVRVQPSGKLISIIDTMRERERDKRAKWQESVFRLSEESDADWVELTFEEVQSVLLSGLRDFRRAKRDSRRKSYTVETKRLVREARKSGSSWAAIERQYDVPVGTARRWV